MRRRLNSQAVAPYVLISPFFILFLAFGAYPTVFSLVMSGYKWGMTGPQAFLGLGNYAGLFTTDPFFMRSIVTTLILLIFGSLTQHVVGLPLAIILNAKRLKAREVFKTMFFLPYITSTVAVTLIFMRLLDNNYGWVNWLLAEVFHGRRINFTTEAPAIRAAIAIILNWRYIGWCTVVYLAGLQAIPEELYESSMLDGANEWQKHVRVTLPLLMPVVFFNVSLSVIFGLQLFDQPYVWTGGYNQMGGSGNAGFTTAFYLMHAGFRADRFGKASAIAWVLFLVIILLTLVTRKITKWAAND
jgi:ABC-type sugar transport system permease subunit